MIMQGLKMGFPYYEINIIINRKGTIAEDV